MNDGRRRDHAAWLPGSVRRVLAHRRGSIAILAAVTLALLAVIAALALDLGNVYVTQSVNQRIADQSALAAALAYGQTNSAATAQSAAASLAVVNQAVGSTVTATIVNSPSGDGNKAAMIVLTTPVSLSPFGQSASKTAATPAGLPTINVSATSYVEIQGKVAPCVIALTSGGIATTGGTSLTATSCAVASGGSVTATNGTSITAQTVYAVGTISSNVYTSPTAGQLVPGSSAPTDPYASGSVFSRLPTVAAMAPSSFPSVSTPSFSFYPVSCSGTLPVSSGPTGPILTSYYPVCNTINFAGGAETDVGLISLFGPGTTINFAAGTYKINGIVTSGGTPVTFNLASNVVLYIWNGIKNNGSSTMTFNGPGTYYVQGGILNGSSSSMTFNNGSSTTPSTFIVAGGISVSNGSASFPNGRYTITSGDGVAGIDVAGGSAATFGNGSFNIANGINLGNGGQLTMGNQLDSNSVFTIPGLAAQLPLPAAIATAGGSLLTLGNFPNFDLNGSILFNGSVALGTGVYTANGALTAASGGGSITGTRVSLVTSGLIAFGAGYSTINLTAPSAVTSATSGTAPTIALASNSAIFSTVTAGASNTVVVGGVYLPNALLLFNGAGNLSGGGGCLEVVASTIALTGGSNAATTCTGLGASGSSGSVALVQ